MNLNDLVVTAARLVPAQDDPGWSLRNIHVLRALVAKNRMRLSPTNASERFRIMFPNDLQMGDTDTPVSVGLTPRTSALMTSVSDEPSLLKLVKGILDDSDDGEVQMVMMLARATGVELISGQEFKAISWEPTLTAASTALDPSTGQLTHRTFDLEQAVAEESKRYNLPD